MSTAIQPAPTIAIDTIRSDLANRGWSPLPLLFAAEVAASRARFTAIAAACDARGRHPVLGDVVQFEPGFDPTGLDPEARELGVRKWMWFNQDPHFHAQLRDPRIRRLLDALLGPGARLLQAMALSKPPGIGSAKDWHQDTPYFPLTRVDRCLGFWIALDDATHENGCMQFVGGSQRQGMVPHVQGPSGWRLDDAAATRCAAVAESVPVPAGTAIVFDANCIHFTAANRSRMRRRAVQYHYVSADTAPVRPGACRLEDL